MAGELDALAVALREQLRGIQAVVTVGVGADEHGNPTLIVYAQRRAKIPPGAVPAVFRGLGVEVRRISAIGPAASRLA